MKVLKFFKHHRLSMVGTVCGFLVLGLAFFILQGSEPDTYPGEYDFPVKIIGYKPSVNQQSLDPAMIPKFAQELTIPPVFAPTNIRDATGKIIRQDYVTYVAFTRMQVLPPGFPMTTVMAYGGRVKIPGSTATKIELTTPGPTYDNIRKLPIRITRINRFIEPHFMPVDPVLHWANPNAFDTPEPPFNVFPPGYPQAQFPIPHTTHIHGLVVVPQFDGTADEWFTAYGQRGPSYVSNTYEIPNDQPSTQLFYHDHVMGMTRLDVYAGIVSPGYFIRDLNNPLDQANSPLPRGEFEVPLALSDRQFYTDGELAFPRQSPPTNNTFFTPYWDSESDSNVTLVNGKVWPNMNVKRQQYRFRTLAAANNMLFNLVLTDNGQDLQNQLEALNSQVGAGTITFAQLQTAVNQIIATRGLPFTIVGSDGGYLPKPEVVKELKIGITERADVLIDFSKFAPGTKLILRNINVTGSQATDFNVTDPTNLGQVMQFTVLGTPAVTPPALDPALFHPRPDLPTNAPKRLKTTIIFQDDTATNNMRALDGLEFSTPPTEFSLVGSTEEWDFINVSPPTGDADANTHMMHIHLIEFEVINRQAFNADAYLVQWHILNGHMPVTRQVELDPTPYLTGPILPPTPYETGWKDTVQAPPGFVTRIIARWAPQEVPTGGVQPGQNLFPVDTEFPSSTDTFSGPGYMWHCHLIAHEDHDMMRPLAVIKNWAPHMKYPVGRVVVFNNIDYRARSTFTSLPGQTPPTRFDLWERVNNNDGSWQPQIIYAVDDRILFEGNIYSALHVHQAQPGETPTIRTDLWQVIPSSPCEQIDFYVAHHASDPNAAQFLTVAAAGNQADCGAVLDRALALFQHEHGNAAEGAHGQPASGLCDTPVTITVPDGTTFTSDPAVNCYQTHSWLLRVIVPELEPGQQVTVNGRVMKVGVNYPLPPERNHGYALQTTGGAIFIADSGSGTFEPPVECTCPAGCSTKTAIAVPFTKEGAGEYCWETTSLGTYINSWEIAALNINGQSYANSYIFTSGIPKIDGKYYIYYKGNFAWSHFEAK